MFATTRWRVVGAEHRDAIVSGGGAVIPAFWHGRLMFLPMLIPPGRRSLALFSRARDGAMIADAARRLGVEAIRGSSRNPRKRDKDTGGREAFAEALAALAEGCVVGITPDGPRGPRMRAQTGVAALSAVSGAPVLPIAVSTRRGLFAPSWDRLLIGLPFDRGVIVYGAPMPAPPSDDAATVEARRRAVEETLIAITAEADRQAGRAPVPPDPEPAEAAQAAAAP